MRGDYHPMQFAVRMDPWLRSEIPPSLTPLASDDLSLEAHQAISTFLHESIHWWQYTGSTLGLMLTLCFPAQASINFTRLKNIINVAGPRKSLRSYYYRHHKAMSDALYQDFNFVLHNWHDIEFARRVLMDPGDEDEVSNDMFYTSVGHSYHIFWRSIISVLALSADPGFLALPQCDKWINGFQDRQGGKAQLKTERPNRLGATSLFEAQARMSQLQYLHLSSHRKQGWEYFEKNGWLGAEYMKAFDLFLKILQEPRPVSIVDPLVCLFLVACDIAINPTAGFPFNIESYETFVQDVEPGWRFDSIAREIATNHPYLKRLIKNCSRADYLTVSETLCGSLGWPSTHEAATTIGGWPDKFDGFAKLMEEDRTFRFAQVDLPVRLFLSRFISLQLDKAKYPQYFVWPGFHSGVRLGISAQSDEIRTILNRNGPLFLSTFNGEVQPRLELGDRTSDDIYATFNAFYQWIILYDLIFQWMARDGPFELNFNWLTKRESEVRDAASHIFRSQFGHEPGEFDTTSKHSPQEVR